MKKIYCLLLLTLSTLGQSWSQGNRGTKKVYADYHGTRYSREFDGELGRWSFYGLSEKSATSRKLMAYNADLILPDGKNQVAAVNYPLTGVQSNLDPVFIEFQILSAKTAKIDGFFIEWGFPEHESTKLLRAFQKEAVKYNFEVGVNWCDGWLFYDWITKIRPEIATRQDKVRHFAKSYQFLIDSVFNVPTAPLVKGIPVYYLFGGGITNSEYASAITGKSLVFPPDIKRPQGLRRVAEWGTITNDEYRASPKLFSEFQIWDGLGFSPTAWIPPRVRNMDNLYPYWDNYGTTDDVLRYLVSFRDSVWNKPAPNREIKCGFVTPGMDNRGCGGWGRGHYYGIPRDDGKLYSQMWDFNLKSKDRLDAMFIASWSDYTEGHEIEPTVENGYRELRTTHIKAADFKGEKSDLSGMGLPIRLFRARKLMQFYKECGYRGQDYAGLLNSIAVSISSGNYREGKKQLDMFEKKTLTLTAKVARKSYVSRENLLANGKTVKHDAVLSPDSAIYLSLENAITDSLNAAHFEGFIEFEYLDAGKLKPLVIRSNTQKSRKDFGTVGELRTANSGEWKKARMKIIKGNVDFSAKYPFNAVFKMEGGVAIRNLSLDFTTYQMR